MSLPRELANRYKDFWEQYSKLRGTTWSVHRALLSEIEHLSRGRAWNGGDELKFWLRVSTRTYINVETGQREDKNLYTSIYFRERKYKRIWDYANRCKIPFNDEYRKGFIIVPFPIRLECGFGNSYKTIYKELKIPSTMWSLRLRQRIAAKFYLLSRNRSARLIARFGKLSETRTYRGAFRSYILELHGHSCDHCGKKETLEIDHKIPWSMGGRTTIDNARVLCSECNKGTFHLRQKHLRLVAS